MPHGLSPIERILDTRMQEHQRAMEPLALAALEALERQGIVASVIGSLAKGRFSAFSDVDFVIHGNWDETSRAYTVIEDIFGEMPFDVVCFDALREHEINQFMDGAIDASGLRDRYLSTARSGSGA